MTEALRIKKKRGELKKGGLTEARKSQGKGRLQVQKNKIAQQAVHWQIMVDSSQAGVHENHAR
jgi:hypothetical protein